MQAFVGSFAGGLDGRTARWLFFGCGVGGEGGCTCVQIVGGKRFWGGAFGRSEKFYRKSIFPLENEFTMLYSNSCDRRPVRFGPLAQLVRAVGS